MDGIEAREEVDGQILIRTPSGGEHRILIPAGVGVPGADDEALAAALAGVLLARGDALPQVLDASQVLAREPGLLAVVAERIDGA